MTFQAYDENQVRNLQLNQISETLFEEGRLTPPQYEQVKNDFYVSLKQPNLFVRLGLFLFTSMCIGFSIGLITYITGLEGSGQMSWGFLLLFFGIALTALNEKFIKSQHWYRQGSDNALCYASISCLVFGLIVLFDINDSWFMALLSCLLLSLATVRYGDPFLALAAFYALLYTFLYLIIESQISFLAVPFVGIFLSTMVYYLITTASKRADLFYWEDCFTVLKIASLVVLYGSVNYYVVATFNQMDIEKGIPMPFNVFFAFATAVLPLVYLINGIQTKDRILWIMGGLGIVASVMTYRHYFELMPIEYALTLAGVAFLALAVFLIKYLKTARNGFVYEPKHNKNNVIEALVVNQFLPQTPHTAVAENKVKFGGGNFDGGGAGGDI